HVTGVQTCALPIFLRVETIVGGGGGGVPVETVFDGVFRIFPEKSAGGGFVGRAADVLKAPMEGLHTAVVVRGPAAMLVAADFALEEVHERSQPLRVYSRRLEMKRQRKRDRKSVV